jgi:hypothetical protein
MYLKWGTVGGRGKGNGEHKKGGVSIQPTWDQSGQESHHNTKEGFQVSKRGGQETRDGGFPSKGGYQKAWVMHSDIMLILYISC